MKLSYAVCAVLLTVFTSLGVNCELYQSFKDKSNEPHRIAIIGGGIGGTATAHFLHQLTGGSALIDVYESGRVGGRLATTSIKGEYYETGGSIIHPDNRYMKQFVKDLGLTASPTCSLSMGLFDGNEWVFRDSSWQAVSLARLFWRYGWGIYRLFTSTQDMLSRFNQIYGLQRRGLTFPDPATLLYAMHPTFPGMAKLSTRDYLLSMGLAPIIVDELVTAVTLCNYGQTPDIHAFVGSISVSAASPRLWSVSGGNKQVPELLLAKSRATLLRRHVTHITVANSSHTVFQVTSEDPSEGDPVLYSEGSGSRHKGGGEDPRVQEYDAVIVATPLTQDKSNIKFLNTSTPLHFPGRYERVLATLVQGKLHKNAFKMMKANEVDEILVVKPELVYNSIGLLMPVDDSVCSTNTALPVYKVFSGKPLKDEQLKLLFSEINNTEVVDWLAYPHYDSNQSMGEFELQPGLYHVNAIEWAGSAMEMSAIAARNIALLALKYLTGDPTAGDLIYEKKEEL